MINKKINDYIDKIKAELEKDKEGLTAIIVLMDNTDGHVVRLLGGEAYKLYLLTLELKDKLLSKIQDLDDDDKEDLNYGAKKKPKKLN